MRALYPLAWAAGLTVTAAATAKAPTAAARPTFGMIDDFNTDNFISIP